MPSRFLKFDKSSCTFITERLENVHLVMVLEKQRYESFFHWLVQFVLFVEGKQDWSSQWLGANKLFNEGWAVQGTRQRLEGLMKKKRSRKKVSLEKISHKYIFK